MEKFGLNISGPGGVIYEGECESLILPVHDGTYGIQAKHCNAIIAMVPGKVVYTSGEIKNETEIGGGIAEFSSNKAILLTF